LTEPFRHARAREAVFLKIVAFSFFYYLDWCFESFEELLVFGVYWVNLLGVYLVDHARARKLGICRNTWPEFIRRRLEDEDNNLTGQSR